MWFLKSAKAQQKCTNLCLNSVFPIPGAVAFLLGVVLSTDCDLFPSPTPKVFLLCTPTKLFFVFAVGCFGITDLPGLTPVDSCKINNNKKNRDNLSTVKTSLNNL